jgi:ribonucleoside-diphosphate reductase alpha chain
MPQLSVRTRYGVLVSFDQSRITSAIEKAFLALEPNRESFPEVALLSDQVVEQLHKKTSQQVETTTSVEEIQEVVETHLMASGFFEQAKAYIRYRERQRQKREEAIALLRAKTQQEPFTIITSSKKRATFSHTQFDSWLSRQYDLFLDLYKPTRVLHLDSIKELVFQSLFPNITTSQLLDLVIQAATSLIEQDPLYENFAGLLLRQKLSREVAGKEVGDDSYLSSYAAAFRNTIIRGVEKEYYDPKLLEFDLEQLATQIDPYLDRNISYLGGQTLYERYLLRDGDQVIETYQGFFMRVAMGLSINEQNKEAWAKQFYLEIASLRFVPSTPTLFHSGLIHPQLSSCYLSVVDDDLAHIFKVMGDNAALSKWSGGIGNDWTKVRGTGAFIQTTKVTSQGVVPFLKIANDVTVAINRSGKRRGATCAYLEVWHWDIEDFLDLRRNTGDERRRTHDMNTAVWVPDLFMKRVQEKGPWTLFSPNEVPELHETYGRTFETYYLEYEEKAAQGILAQSKTVNAQDLWRKMLTRLFETGHPWITFKDPCNVRSPQDHAGVIHHSNLCTEITLNTSNEETAVCNLGSLNLAQLADPTDPSGLDPIQVEKTLGIAMRMLDNVIDINYYPTPEAKTSNLRHRPVGLGIMGFQDYLLLNGEGFLSPRACELADRSMELVSYYALFASSRLAKDRGPYESYRGSKWDRGILPQDTLDLLEQERARTISVDRSSHLDWSVVRKHIQEHGMRNSNTMAIAPTATISTIAGTYPCIEPLYKNLYVKSNMSGEFTVVNKYLVHELSDRGLWNKSMLDKIKGLDGSIQAIEEIPEEIRIKFPEAFEVNPLQLLEIAARRGKWIDQSQSYNLFLRGTSGKLLDQVYTHAWELGLKTTYYLRSQGASQIEKSTLNIAEFGMTQRRAKVEQPTIGSHQPSDNPPLCKIEDPECEACQ